MGRNRECIYQPLIQEGFFVIAYQRNDFYDTPYNQMGAIEWANVYYPGDVSGPAPLISFAHGFGNGGDFLDERNRECIYQPLVQEGFFVIAYQRNGFCDTPYSQMGAIEWADAYYPVGVSGPVPLISFAHGFTGTPEVAKIIHEDLLHTIGFLPASALPSTSLSHRWLVARPDQAHALAVKILVRRDNRNRTGGKISTVLQCTAFGCVRAAF